MFDLEAMATYLHINKTDLSDVAESKDALVGDINELRDTGGGRGGS